jgi:hypothetical protein
MLNRNKPEISWNVTVDLNGNLYFSVKVDNKVAILKQ